MLRLNIRKVPGVVLVSVILLASCSSDEAPETADTPAPEAPAATTVVQVTVDVSTTVVDTTTTTTTVPVPASNCLGTEADLEEVVGEPLGFFSCDREWASFMTKEYAQTCENCESLSIAQWADGSWEEVGNFNQYAMLSPKDVSKAMTSESLCVIWAANRSSEVIAKTGCTPDS